MNQCQVPENLETRLDFLIEFLCLFHVDNMDLYQLTLVFHGTVDSFQCHGKAILTPSIENGCTRSWGKTVQLLPLPCKKSNARNGEKLIRAENRRLFCATENLWHSRNVSSRRDIFFCVNADVISPYSCEIHFSETEISFQSTNWNSPIQLYGQFQWILGISAKMTSISLRTWFNFFSLKAPTLP